MLRNITVATISTVGFGILLALSGCSESCESLQDKIQDIGLEIQKSDNPWEHEEELTKIRDKMQEMGCLG